MGDRLGIPGAVAFWFILKAWIKILDILDFSTIFKNWLSHGHNHHGFEPTSTKDLAAHCYLAGNLIIVLPTRIVSGFQFSVKSLSNWKCEHGKYLCVSQISKSYFQIGGKYKITLNNGWCKGSRTRDGWLGLLRMEDRMGLMAEENLYCQKWDSNPRPQKWTATWTQRLRPLGHPDILKTRKMENICNISAFFFSHFCSFCSFCLKINLEILQIWRLVGLEVWFSLRVREVPGSIPGRALVLVDNNYGNF